MRIAAHIARVLLGLMFLMNQISARYRSCSMKLPEDLQLHGSTSRVLDELSQSIHATSSEDGSSGLNGFSRFD